MDFDVIVIGGGHAGCEASYYLSNKGLSVCLVTSDKSKLGFMSCNPSIGGLGKGHMVKELDALGGLMPRVADKAAVQFKKLNTKKGPAVRGTRAQCDKDLYVSHMTGFLNECTNLTIHEDTVNAFKLEKDTCKGVLLSDGSSITSTYVILTAGTFMGGVIHSGLNKESGGRIGEKATFGLSDQLNSLGVEVHRLKTGTPPRLDSNSINYEGLEVHNGDSKVIPFHFFSKPELQNNSISCYLTYTNSKTHDFIHSNLEKSPLFSGLISGVGPRYCPSIEDKVTRFPDRDRHQSFLEPEGLNTNSVYLQGVSTSLPPEVQDMFVRSMKGLESVKFLKYGYAVEYDFMLPTQLKKTLETKYINNLYLAGQVNGTSGYEEAASQGFWAAANVYAKHTSRESFILPRYKAYIGVLIDDLVTCGTLEPYRMMTSRAEFRLSLREDNVYERLSSPFHPFSNLTKEESISVRDFVESVSLTSDVFKDVKLVPNPETQAKLKVLGTTPLLKPQTGWELLKRPELSFQDVFSFLSHKFDEVPESSCIFSVETNAKYEGYISRESLLISELKKRENILIPPEIEYSEIHGLSTEEIEKLNLVRPLSLAQASRISGVNPSAVQILWLFLKRT